MDDSSEKPAAETPSAEATLPNAWQPFTPRGVAAFAHAPLARVFAFQLIIALLSAGILIWFLNANYFPSVLEAIQNLPDETLLKNGELTHVSSGVLSEKKFLSIAVDLEETGQVGKTADLQLELRRNYFQLCSLLGCVPLEYPPEEISLGRATAEPWWSARQPVIFGIIGMASFAGLWLNWLLLAVVYTPVAKLVAFFAERELSWIGSWKLSSAAQMFAALLMNLAIVLYGVQAFDLIRFLFFFSAHFVVAWIFVGAAPFFLPRVSMKVPVTKNPFDPK
jgi:hypothetical protein